MSILYLLIRYRIIRNSINSRVPISQTVCKCIIQNSIGIITHIEQTGSSGNKIGNNLGFWGSKLKKALNL